MLTRWVFRLILKAVVDWTCLLSRSRDRQTGGAAHEKELCPDVLVFTYGTRKGLRSEDERGCLDGVYT